MLNKTSLRNFFGELPLAAELDYVLRQKNRARKDHYNLDRLQRSLPRAVAQVKPLIEKSKPDKNILFFATLHYWIEQSAYISLALAGLGHKVTLMTLPYSEWHKEMDKLTQRAARPSHTGCPLSCSSLRQSSGQAFVEHVSFLDLKPASVLPATLQADVEEISLWDAQYTLMREEVDMNAPNDRAFYDLRIKRNTFAARAALEWMQTNKPDVVLIPNGLILEMGIVFRVARYLNIPAMTYEFNDQREQIWLAQNSSIMQQDTDYLVESALQLADDRRNVRAPRRPGECPPRRTRVGQVETVVAICLFAGRGADAQSAGLDDRPVVMLAANVLGDSLTLGRNIFAASMTEWITKTVQFFANRTDVQLVIRVHPGEKLVPTGQVDGDGCARSVA